VRLLEEPSADNYYTAKLRIADSSRGDDRYHVRIEWEWEQVGPVSGVGTRGGVFARHPRPAVGGPAEPAPVEPRPAAPSAPTSPRGREVYSAANDPRTYDQRNRGEFEFRGRIDGTVVLRIQGDRVFAENLNGRPVEVERFSFSQPLPAARVGEIEVDKKDGRGKLELVEIPWQENEFTAVVRISDSDGGDDRYHFKLKWEK
jgi:hypothetical protein